MPGLSHLQKGRLHQYADAAGLDDFAYRSFLVLHTGKRSSTRLTQADFDRIMPALELRLEEAIVCGEAGPAARRISDLTYGRRRAAATGGANRRQLNRLFALWRQLQDAGGYDDGYLHGLAEKACACRLGDLHSITADHATRVIEALKDRLAHTCAAHD